MLDLQNIFMTELKTKKYNINLEKYLPVLLFGLQPHPSKVELEGQKQLSHCSPY